MNELTELPTDFVPSYDDDLCEPDVCFGSVCVVTWHPVTAVPVGDGFAVI